MAAKWQKWITNVWNQNPGFKNCKVLFNVVVTADLAAQHWYDAQRNNSLPGAQNYIYVQQGNGNPWVDPTFFTGTWFEQTLPWSISHEFGHLLGLIDAKYFPWVKSNDIMKEGADVTQRDIDALFSTARCCK